MSIRDSRPRAAVLARPLRLLATGFVAAAGAALMLAPAATAQSRGTEVGFVEDYALATDREALLDRLVPGTADFYYYHCLHAQQVGDLDGVPGLMRQWRQRHGETARYDMIEQRQTLLLFSLDPERSYDELVRELGLTFDHRREIPGEREPLPTALDPDLVARGAFAERAFDRHRWSFDGLATHALADVVTGRIDAPELTDRRLDDLLRRLDRADLPGLPALVVEHLDDERGRSFGSLPLHGLLTLDQLAECAASRPALLSDANFVNAWLARLAPAAHEDTIRDASARERHLERLERFTASLPKSFDSLRAQIRYHRLRHDLGRGTVDASRLRAYLALPHAHSRTPRRDPREGTVTPVALGLGYAHALPTITGDDALVRACLAHRFRAGDDFSVYTDLLDRDWVARLFAETKILAATGDETAAERERWYTLLDDPTYYEQLERRVDLDFPPTQRTFFGADETVTLDLDVKNVETLLVKVFRIDAVDWYANQGTEVPPSIDLDGLVAGIERTTTYDTPSLRRVRRSFTFDELTGPGTWVVEFIGNGSASRVVVRKGDLLLSERAGAAGHVLTLFDEAGRRVRDGQVQFAGRRFTSDENGEIAIPFTTNPGRRTVVLIAGDRAALGTFQHASERYALEAGFFVERESLVAGGTARVLVRPRLLAGGALAAPVLLEDAALRIDAVDLDGTPTSSVVRDLELTTDGEYVHTFAVPDRLQHVSFRLSGRVESAIGGEDQRLEAASRTHSINGIDATTHTTQLLLSRDATGYALDVLGKNGEARPGAIVSVELRHADFRDAFTIQLETDERGRATLGTLPGIAFVNVGGPNGIARSWRLRGGERSLPGAVHGIAGETLRVPHPGGRTRLSHETLSLVELRGGAIYADRFENLRINRNYIELAGLEPGTYRLRLPVEGWSLDVQVAPGVRDGNWAVGGAYALELSERLPLQLAAVRVDGDDLVVLVDGATSSTRVHLWSTRYLPSHDPFDDLFLAPLRSLDGFDLGDPRSDFNAERDIGDEMRYILARRLRTVFPGNMLRRPSLLLNPWDIGLASESFEDTIGLGGGAGGAGGKFGARRGGRARSQGSASGSGGAFASLDFLAYPSTTVANLAPNEAGLVRVPLADLGVGQQIHVLVCDANDTIASGLLLGEGELAARDLRLAEALSDDTALGESRELEVLAAGASTTIADRTSADFNSFETLADAFGLLDTLCSDDRLARFEFLTRWPSIADDEKRSLYSEHACHELHLFLRRKDPAFFDAVVRPFLANKRDRTFLDHYLLEADLTRYLEPWEFRRLNVLERVLLTQRLTERRADGQRHLAELLAALPPSEARDLAVFGATLTTMSLDTQDQGISEYARGTYRGPGDTVPPGTGQAPMGGGPPPPAAAARPSADRSADAFMDPNNESALGIGGGGGGRDFEELEAAGAALRDELSLDGIEAEEQLKALGYLADDLEQRRAGRGFYRPVDATRTWAEHNYFQRRIAEHLAGLVAVDRFWNDFAQWDGTGAFVSAHFGEAAGNVNEALLALAVLDLPFEAGEHGVVEDGTRLDVTAASPLVLARRELRPLERADDAAPILVSQNLLSTREPVIFIDGQPRDRFVTSEFIVGVPYTCRVVVTNPTSAPRQLELLLQIPAGAMPIAGGRVTRGLPIALAPYGTRNVEFSFYFPAPGEFAQYPAQVSEDELVVASAQSRTLTVRSEPTVIDTTSWEYVSQRGSLEEVILYLDGANLAQVDLARIAWRMSDRAAFDAVLAHLRGRMHFAGLLWSYGLKHRDERASREYMETRSSYLARCGLTLDTPLVSIDPVERRSYEHLEFDPLVNARAHRMRERAELFNADVARQYLDLLDVLAQTPVLDDDDRLQATYFLLLQDRVAEALEQYALIDRDALDAQLQYDYLTAYLDFFSDRPTVARGIAERYLDHPVDRWRERFEQVIAQLDEAEGRATGIVDEDDRTERNTQLAASEPALELAVEGRRVRLTHANVERVEVGYYPMDVEVLFSSSPFVQGGGAGAFSYVEPLRRDVVEIAAGSGETGFELPSEYANANLLLEVRAGALVRRETVFAGSLAVQWMDNYGQVRVTHAESGRALSKVYVKVYARESDGSVRFHKDGYTDLRGRFDYASVSGENASGATRFAVLVLSDEYGARIREVVPPAQ